MIRIFLFLTLLTFLSCNKDSCTLDENFLEKNVKIKPDLLITSENGSCDKLFLKGNFYYQSNEFNIKYGINLKDSTYSYPSNPNDFIFDFSQKKRQGILKINDSLKLPVFYFMDIKSEDSTFRLFKIDNIESYENLDLSMVFVVNYHYGIVGEFVTSKEKGIWQAINYKGYIPNKKYFYSIFEKAELL